MINLSNINLLTDGAIIGAIIAFWSKIKGLLSMIISIFVVTVKIEGKFQEAISYYLWNNLVILPIGIKRFSAQFFPIKKLNRSQLVGFELIGKNTLVFVKNTFPIFIKYDKEENRRSDGSFNSNDLSLSISFIRRTFDIETFLNLILDFYNTNYKEEKKKRFYIANIIGKRQSDRKSQYGEISASSPGILSEAEIKYTRLLKYKFEEIGENIIVSDSALNLLAFPSDVHELINDVTRWKQSEKWYREKCIAWRRGWLLYGKPGTGKTSLIRALAYDLDLPIYTYDLSTLCNEEMVECWNGSARNAPCIFLLEDIDAIFDGRNNRLKSDLTFDCLLNCISGIHGTDGILLFITTNQVGSLDAALGIPKEGSNISTRPGRVDRLLELKDMDESCRRVLASRILSDCQFLIDDTVKAGSGDTGAQFSERCTQLALKEYWKK